MSDIDKLMSKLKDKKKPSKDEKEEEQEEEVEEEGEEEEIEDEKKIPATVDDKIPDDAIDQEVAILNNDGIFRRELLLSIKELVDVHKINTQTLLDLKSRLEGDDGKGKKGK